MPGVEQAYVTEEREVVLLILALAICAAVGFHRGRVRHVQGYLWLVGALGAWTFACALTVAEGYVDVDVAPLLNGIEHVSVVAHTLCLLIWVWRFATNKTPAHG